MRGTAGQDCTIVASWNVTAAKGMSSLLLPAAYVVAAALFALPNRPAGASIVQPCQQVLAGARSMGEAAWIKACARGRLQTGLPESDAVRDCRRWLTMCRKDLRYPLPPGVNNL